MRRFYVRRKDLSAFPFQFTYDRQGRPQPLARGATYTYSILPPKEGFNFLHVHIHEAFINRADAEWDLPAAEMIRVAAAAMQAWVAGEVVPEDHFNGTDMLFVDLEWYPREAAGGPRLASQPYDFEVVVDEPWATDGLWAASAGSAPA